MQKAPAYPPKAVQYGYPPRGLDHDAAARYVGVDPAAFDDLLHLGKLPGPRQVCSALVWDRACRKPCRRRQQRQDLPGFQVLLTA